jgi:hypothetical protein
MTNKIVNIAPFLLTSRKFPKDPELLETELSKSYLDTANSVNQREIALYAQKPIITGQQWYGSTSGQTQQTLRQIYSFSDSLLTIPHGITNFVGITRVFGTFFDGTMWYPLPYVSPTATDQVAVKIGPVNILITKGTTAPAISSGTVVLEWFAS